MSNINEHMENWNDPKKLVIVESLKHINTESNNLNRTNQEVSKIEGEDKEESGHEAEPNFKFNQTFKSLCIDLNDEPTEFNVEEICVNNAELGINEHMALGPVILSPIVYIRLTSF